MHLKNDFKIDDYLDDLELFFELVKANNLNVVCEIKMHNGT